VVVCAIAPENEDRWQPKELDVVSKFAAAVMKKASIDPAAAGRYEKYTGFARYARAATAQPLKAWRHCQKSLCREGVNLPILRYARDLQVLDAKVL